MACLVMASIQFHAVGFCQCSILGPRRCSGSHIHLKLWYVFHFSSELPQSSWLSFVHSSFSPGLAVGQGVWTSLIVIISFIWGGFIFEEKFTSFPIACAGAALIVLGAIGMTAFGIKKEDEHASEPSKGTYTKWSAVLAPAERPKCEEVSESLPVVGREPLEGVGPLKVARYASYLERRGMGGSEGAMGGSENDPTQDQNIRNSSLSKNDSQQSLASSVQSSTDSEERFQRLLEDVSGIIPPDPTLTALNAEDASLPREKPVGDRLSWQGRGDVYVELCGFKMHRKTYGILAAVFNGLYGGSVMAPLKFAGGAASGISFVISFGIGVLGTPNRAQT